MAWPRRGIALGLSFFLATLIPAPPAGAQNLPMREVVATGLEWPVSIAVVPEAVDGYPEGSIFYSERFTGNIHVLVNGAPRPDPVASVPVRTAGEQGLLGIALDPAFASTPWIYAYHTYFNGTAGRDMNRVVRFWLGPPTPPRMEIVLDGIPAAIVHNGGILGFAPDGTLFITTGDATVPANSQDLSIPAGKILRVNPDGTIPTDNPFAVSPVYSFGHRNVFGLAFHPVTGQPFISENGPQCNDELNALLPGRNYGWGPTQTCATPPGSPSNTNRDGPSPVLPIFWWRQGIAPTGVAFYIGNASAWRNALFLGDWLSGTLQMIHLTPDFHEVANVSVVDSIGPGGILDVEMGPDGVLYVTTPDTIFRVTGPVGDSGVPPAPGPNPAVYILLAVAVGVAILIVSTVVRSRRAPPR